jgi:hypothetical protein
MWCMVCKKELFECTCPDIEERLEFLSRSPYVAPAAISNLAKRKAYQDSKTVPEIPKREDII